MNLYSHQKHVRGTLRPHLHWACQSVLNPHFNLVLISTSLLMRNSDFDNHEVRVR